MPITAIDGHSIGNGLPAVAVGGTSFERGNGWLLGTLLGVISVGVLRNGLNLISLPFPVTATWS